MKINILGCSGGLQGSGANGPAASTTCIQVTDNIIIDAGSGLNQLSLEAMQKINHVVLTHGHMDHICYLPQFLANQFEPGRDPVTIHALPETIDVLKDCIFNSQIWPDLSQLPSPDRPVMQFKTVEPWQGFELEGTCFTPFFVEHTVPTVGYSVKNAGHHFVFAADTTASDVLIDELNRLGTIDTLMIECSFPNDKDEIARMSKHMTPALIHSTLTGLAAQPAEVWITHMKPGSQQKITTEIQSNPDYRHWRILP